MRGQRQRPQETFTMREEKLWQQLAESSADSARQTLASLEASEALQLLVRVLARDERKTISKAIILKRIVMAFYGILGIWILIDVISGSSKLDLSAIAVLIMSLSILWTVNSIQLVGSQRKKTAALLLPDLVPRLNRTDIPLVLELAPQANLDDNALFMWLGYGLGRMPMDERAALSPEARQGLRLLTQDAIEKSKTEQKAEALAIAGLLALGSLKDTSLAKMAERAALYHTRGHVCAAAEEYLEAL